MFFDAEMFLMITHARLMKTLARVSYLQHVYNFKIISSHYMHENGAS
jgi:hypothetical protein